MREGSEQEEEDDEPEKPTSADEELRKRRGSQPRESIGSSGKKEGSDGGGRKLSCGKLLYHHAGTYTIDGPCHILNFRGFSFLLPACLRTELSSDYEAVLAAADKIPRQAS